MTSLEDAVKLSDQFWIDIASTVGECLCGCGQERPEFDMDGVPRMFINGHQSRGRMNANFGKPTWNKGLQGVQTKPRNRPAWNKGLKGVYKASEETKKKMSDNHAVPWNKGKTLSEEHKKKVSETKKAKKKQTDQETKKKLSDALNRYYAINGTRRHSKATKKKLSESLKLYYFNNESKNHMFGKSHTEASKKKMSQARKRYWASRRKAATPM